MKGLLRLLVLFAAFVAQTAAGASVFVIVNDRWRGFVTLDIDDRQQPCLTAPLLLEWGVLPATIAALSFSGDGCALPKALSRLPVRVYYVHEAQLLTLLIPSELLNHVANGVAASRWDDGINAAFIDYDIGYSHYTGENYGLRQHALDIDLLYGVNLGAWRFRYEPVYSKDIYSNARWHTEKANAFRSIRSLRALLTLGDNSTPDSVFDSVSYRGISLVNDDRMLPDELRPLSPWLHGFARTEAEVKIRQYGTVIYQTTVPAGAFVLKDVYPMDSSADLEMTIKEEDGTETVRTLPYTAMPNLVRKAQWKYALTAGKYRPYYTLDEQEPLFAQTTLSYGLPNDVSLYGGAMLATLYRGAVLGAGKRFAQWGAVSLDIGFSQAAEPRRERADRGTQVRWRYTKAFSDWESSVSATALYYPGQRYRSFSKAISQQTRYWWDWEDDRFIGEIEKEKKQALSLSYSQNFSEEDNFYLTLTSEKRHGKHQRDTQVEAGYSVSYGAVDYSIGFTYERPRGEKEQSLLTLSVALPLRWFGLARTKLDAEYGMAKNGASTRKTGLTGTLLEDYSLSYNLSNTLEEGVGRVQRMSVNYQYNAGNVLGIYNRKKLSSSKYLSLTGSAMLHEQGITLGQTLGETVALVEVPETDGIGIINQYGTTTDARGFAVIGNLTPYRVNELMLDGFSLTEGRTLPDAETEVVPTAGAIMYSRFKTPVATVE